MGEELRKFDARCLTLDIDITELSLHGRSPVDAAVADGYALPVRSESVDIAHSSNVLEHVAEPWRFLTELARIVRPAGLIYLSFTNWYSPWGGHDTAPWHYLGGQRATRRYMHLHGHPPTSELGKNLFPIHIGEVLRWLRQQDNLTIVHAAPRYYPSWARPIILIPGVREFLTWNPMILIRKVSSILPKENRAPTSRL